MKGFFASILSITLLVCGCQEGEQQGEVEEGADPALQQAREAAQEASQKADEAQRTAAEAKGAAVEALEAAESAELNRSIPSQPADAVPTSDEGSG